VEVSVESNGFINVLVKPFLAPRSHVQSQKAKITEPDRIIFLENQDELAPPLF
jgi:hypothetical protein